MKQLFLALVVASLLCSPAISLAATRYVNLNNSGPAAPFTTWATAATNIQHAIDAAVAGDEIIVTNGLYATGGRAVYGMSNRVAVTKPLTLRSVNGPEATHIVGYQVPGTINGAAAVRCVYLTNDAVLSGFTLTNGATQTSGDAYTNRSGGGVWCEAKTTVVTNCVIVGNSAFYLGGGSYCGTLNNCTVMQYLRFRRNDQRCVKNIPETVSFGPVSRMHSKIIPISVSFGLICPQVQRSIGP